MLTNKCKQVKLLEHHTVLFFISCYLFSYLHCVKYVGQLPLRSRFELHDKITHVCNITGKNNTKNNTVQKNRTERLSSTFIAILGFVRILGLFVIWVGLYFLDLVYCFCGASKASRAHSETFGLDRILGLDFSGSFKVLAPTRICWICFVVFAEQTKRAEPTRKLLTLIEFWVYSKFGFVRFFGFGLLFFVVVFCSSLFLLLLLLVIL